MRSRESQAVKDSLAHLGMQRWKWIVALILLCTPNYHLVDPFPDVIAWILLYSSLRNLSETDESFGEANRLIYRLVWLSLGKIAALLVSFAMLNEYERPVGILLSVFVFGILELMTVLPALTQIFHGLSYLGMRSDAPFLLEKSNETKAFYLRKKLNTLEAKPTVSYLTLDRLRRKIERLNHHGGTETSEIVLRYCQVFAVLKTVLTVLPEFSALSVSDHAANAAMVNWYMYVGGFRIMAILVGVAVGLLWLFRTLKYVDRITADDSSDFWALLVERFKTYATDHPERIPKRDMRFFSGFLLAGSIFLINFSLDSVNLLPTFLFGCFSLISFIFAGKYLPARVRNKAFAVASGQMLVSALNYGVTFWFYSIRNYDISILERSTEMQRDYRLLCGATLVENVANVLLVGAIMIVSFSLIRDFTFCVTSSDRADAARETERRLQQKELKKRFIPTALFGFLASGAHVAAAFLCPTYSFVWIPDALISVLFVICFSSFRSELNERLHFTKMTNSIG